MSASELAELFDQNANRAFRITLWSGDIVDVRDPRRTRRGIPSREPHWGEDCGILTTPMP
jgi:hypothetical protein